VVNLYTDTRYTAADAAVIRWKVQRIVGRFGYRRQDIEDLEQDVAMHVFRQACRYRPERGPRERFVATVAKHRLLHLVGRRMAAKRGQGRTVNRESWQDEWLRDRRVTPSQVRLAIDVRLALARLPVDLRQVASLLLQGHRARDLERLLGLSRQRVRCRIRRLAVVLDPLRSATRKNSVPANHPVHRPGNQQVTRSLSGGLL
jgi:DNA-directed RNA polymerase specialized sigma24 family protein